MVKQCQCRALWSNSVSSTTPLMTGYLSPIALSATVSGNTIVSFK